MDRQQTSAMAVATTLDRLGFKVHYPGLANHPGRDIHERNADGYGAVLSFTTGDKALSERIVGATRLWGISVSFGCVNSLISMPCVMSYVLHLSTFIVSLTPTQIAMHLLIRLCVRNVACPRTSFACVLVSKTRWTSSMTLSMPSSRPGQSLSPQALINTSLFAPLSPAEESLLVAQLRNLPIMSIRRGKERTANGSLARRERSSCSESMPLFTVS